MKTATQQTISEKVPPSGGNQSSTRKGEKHEAVFTMPHTMSAMEGLSQKSVQRTVRFPIAKLKDEDWLELRKLAFQCSRYGNHLLTENYAKVKGLSGLEPYTDFNTVLSSTVRDAVGRECVGIWRRLGKKILRGEQTLARFSADRALVIRGNDPLHPKNIIISADNISLPVRPKGSPKGNRIVLPFYMLGIEKDWYLSDLLAKMQNGEVRISKASISFKRPGRKVFVFVSYEKKLHVLSQSERTAHLKVSEMGELWLRYENRSMSLTHTIENLKSKKRDFRGIHARLRRALKRKARHKALLKVGGYEEWSLGVIHQLTAQIVGWCLQQGCGRLLLYFPKDISSEEQQDTVAWSRIATILKYKCEEQGIQYELHEIMPIAPTAKELEKLKTELDHVTAVTLG